MKIIVIRSIIIICLLLHILGLLWGIVGYFNPKFLYYKIIVPIRNIFNVTSDDIICLEPKQNGFIIFQCKVVIFIIICLLCWWKIDADFRLFVLSLNRFCP